MTGIYGSHPEDKAWQGELRKYEDECDKAEQRQERIEAFADDLMQEGEEFYPFAPSRLSEALSEMPANSLRVLAACLAEADSKKSNDNIANHLALTAILMPVKEYWRKAAIQYAEERTK